ncbi:hypothetical protein BDV95DRAFT_602450 [Massariosphaeria phaeospora]|uniref:MARVEL domain-containing protein n=1 Tax=Massariosphaeria phaeospora TaxID=100035 RepID=A0A7C8IH54_9PLEO|nr:hypothetical protein BDV95DRAFT_602450 [Massariosphaeria phaeospora]
MVYMPRGGAVPIPRWVLGLRAFQLLFAILTLALTAYALSIRGGGPLQPPLVATIIISILTLVPILLLTTPLHLVQRKFYDPRTALLLDGIALLFWLGSFAALASYHRVYWVYGRENFFVLSGFDVCRKCRAAWRAGTAATVFAAIEFLLFLLTTLLFIYYYHAHLADETVPGVPRRETHKAESAIAGTAVDNTTGPRHVANGTTGTHHSPTGATGTIHSASAHRREQHQLNDLPPQTSPVNNVPASSTQSGGTHGGIVAHSTPPYPDTPRPPYPDTPRPPHPDTPRPPRPGGYGGYENGSMPGNGVESTRL